MRSKISVLGVLLLISTAQAGTYTVQKGDTLYSLARHHQMSTEELMKLNGLTEPVLSLGQVLQVPDLAPARPPATPKTHTVAKQETLYGIARSYGLKVEDLKAWNGLTSNDLEIGQVLQLQAAAQPKPEAKAEVKTEPKTPAASKNTKTAEKTSVSPTAPKTDTSKAIKTPEVKTSTKTPEVKPQDVQVKTAETKLPETKTPEAKPAEASVKPAEPRAQEVKLTATGTYIVEKGDTLFGLTRKLNVRLDDLRAWNNLAGDDLAVGQELQLSAPRTLNAEVKAVVKAEVKAALKETSKPEPEKINIQPVKVLDTVTTIVPAATAERHVVQKGDTLSVLARKYGTTVGALQEANSLLSTDLKVGQVLLLPSSVASIPAPTNLVDIVSDEPNVWRDYAMSLLNLPYIYGGNSPEKGLDCSGFTLVVMQQVGVRLPRTSLEQSRFGEDVDVKSLQEGDLVFFDTLGHGVSHVGIYLGDNQFIHANSYLERVSIDDITNSYYAKRLVGAKRVLPGVISASRR